MGAIVIEGNNRTDVAVIQNILGLTIGDPFDEEQLDVMWDKLEDTGYFIFVDMDYEEEETGEITLYVTVEEDRTLRIYPWAAYDRRHKYLLGAVVHDINLRGKGEIADLRASAIYIQRIRASWMRPRFLDQRRFTLTLAGGWENADFVYRPTDYNWWDAGVWLRWHLSGAFYLEGGLMYGAFNQRDTFSELAPDRGGGPGPDVTWLAGWRYRWTPEIALGWENRDNIYYPVRGGYYRLGVSFVEGVGFPSYTEWSADLRQFLSLPWKHVVGMRAYGRAVSRPVPPEDRLYWGGEPTIRGYGYALFEGEEGYLLTLEYRAPLFLMPLSPDGQVFGIGLHLFGDGGDTWYEGATSGDTRWSWGAGAHLLVATLQLRFEVARTEDGRTTFQFFDVFNF